MCRLRSWFLRIDLIYKLKRPYRTNAVFLTANSTLSAIRKLKDSTGQYLWQPALTAGEPDRLLGCLSAEILVGKPLSTT